MGARSAGLAAGSGRSSPLVRPLTGGVEPAVEFGGKGASLTRLIDAGFPVPGGFCITTEAHRRALAEASPAAVEVSAALGEAILSAYRGLGSPAVAVRSSATVEDGTSDSYAGQFESLLDVRGDDALLAAVQSCWRSAAAERAQSYLRRSGTTDLPAVAVVVQRMVDADAAGVLFTADPVSGNDGVLVVEAVPGVGEALVSGVSDPSRYVVDRQTGTNLRPQEPRPELLGEQDVATLRDLGNRAVELYGSAMDLEWCRERGSMLIVQARPITTAVRSDPWNDSRHGDFLWTNTNVGEAIPDVMTPATWSMVQVFLTDAMATASIPPYVGYGRVGGRIYLNVSVMLTLSGAVGVSEKRFRQLTAEVFGHLPDDVEIPRVKTGRLPVLKAVLPMAAHMFAEVRRDARVMAAYLDSHPASCERRRADIAAVGHGAALADLWQSTLSPEFHRVSKMLSAATRSSGASFVTTRQRLQRLVGSAAANALTAGLGGEAGELASLGLLDGLDLLARGEIDRPEFARRFGHRGPHEFEISTPRPGEDPDWIDGELSVRREADSEHDYRSMLRRQEEAREAAWAEVERAHPVQAKVLHHQLRIWARISRNRERARSEVIRYFWVLRDYVLRAGALSGLGDDAFYLDKGEILRVLQGGAIDAGVIAARRNAYREYRALPPYPVLIRGPFDPYAWVQDPDRRSDFYQRGTRHGPDAVRGFPGSAGVVEGIARVLADASDGAQLQPGDVLVTTVTNVGWTPLFPRCAAVVTDVGAPLSHAAIVARELGIPAVVGCGNATMRLRTGDRVRVDGAAGTVEVLEA